MKALFLLPAVLTAFLPLEKAQGQTLVTATGSPSSVRPAVFEEYLIAFHGNSDVLRADYENNSAALEAIAQKINESRAEIKTGQYRIAVSSNIPVAGLSPEEAKKLARRRALVLKSHLIKTLGVVEADFSTRLTTDGRLTSDTRLTIGLVPAAPPQESSPLPAK